MMLLKPGQNYMYLFRVYFGVFVALMIASFVIDFGFCFNAMLVTMPAYMLFLLVSQIRSGVALDSWMVAKHRRGCRTYTAQIAWNFTALIVMIGVAVVAWTPHGP